MEKRYQVFVSSTYADLQDKRSRVIQMLLEMDCIPTGMELFPAADEEQWEFIKKVIDDCDYYLLVIGGRYGSTTPEGVSYTEKEYDYAVEQGIKVIALLHANPEKLPLEKSDIDPELRERLKQFREKVAANRLVKFWKNAEDLPGLVSMSLSKTIKMYPAVGWVRANKISNEDLLREINQLRKDNDNLKQELAKLTINLPLEIDNLARFEELINLSGKYYDSYSGGRKQWSITVTWGDIFALIAPYLLQYPTDKFVKAILSRDLFGKAKIPHGSSSDLNDQDFQTIKIQLIAMGLINVQYSQTTAGGMDLFWGLTSQGNSEMMKLRSVRSSQKES